MLASETLVTATFSALIERRKDKLYKRLLESGCICQCCGGQMYEKELLNEY